MHILYLHQYFKTPEAGGGIRSYEFSKRFLADGYSVTMLTKVMPGSKPFRRGSRVSRVEGIKVVEIPVEYSSKMSSRERMKSFFLFAIKAIKEGRKIETPDIIYATSTPLTIGIPALFLSWYFKIPFVFEVRDLWPEAPIQMGVIRNRFAISFLKKLEKRIYKKAKHIIALSPGMKEGIEASGVPAQKITMVPNCSDLGIFDPDINFSSLEETYGLSKKKVISYAGKINEANGMEVIIDAASYLKNREDILIALAGEGKYKDKLEKRAKEKGLFNLKFLGRISKNEVAQLYGLATACLVIFKDVPILSTNSPNKFFDALAAGRPVITNMDGWVRDLVKEHNLGISIRDNSGFKTGPGKELARSIEEIVDDPERASKMGKNSRKLAEEEFDRDKLFKKVEGILRNVLEKET